jgi:AraC family transcriptional activator of pobA
VITSAGSKQKLKHSRQSKLDTHTSLTLVNPQNGNLAFKILKFNDGGHFDHIQRNNYYSLIWITDGQGKLKADFSEYDFVKNTLFAFSPYQPFMFEAAQMKGTAIFFHPDFFCIHKHQPEVACNGVLFNNIYQPPFTIIDESSKIVLMMLIDQMKTETQNAALAQYEILVSYLKIFLITSSRLKTEQQPKALEMVSDLKEPFILQNLKEAIEKDFKKKHSPVSMPSR